MHYNLVSSRLRHFFFLNTVSLRRDCIPLIPIIITFPHDSIRFRPQKTSLPLPLLQPVLVIHSVTFGAPHLIQPQTHNKLSGTAHTQMLTRKCGVFSFMVIFVPFPFSSLYPNLSYACSHSYPYCKLFFSV